MPSASRDFTREVVVLGDRPVRVVFGLGAMGGVAAEAGALGVRVLLISGSHERTVGDTLAAELGVRLAGRIHGVAPHVPVDVAADAVTLARGLAVDVVIALGGGSAVGLAKAVARKLDVSLLAVPTTYAGSEMTSIWGLTDHSGKVTGRDPRVLPRTVVYDPALTVSLPPAVTAASGMNALAHALEALYSPDLTPEVGAVAEQALASLAAGLPGAVADGRDLAARAEALHGAWLAGWSLGGTTMGLHHKLAHLLGGRFRLPHAGVHSALLPQVADVNAQAAPAAFARAAGPLGVEGPHAVAPRLFDLAAELGAPTSLAELGWGLEGVADVVEAALAAPVTHPRELGSADLDRLLRRAYAGSRPEGLRP